MRIALALAALCGCYSLPAPVVRGSLTIRGAGDAVHVKLDRCESDGALRIKLIGTDDQFVRVEPTDTPDRNDQPSLRVVDASEPGATEVSITPGISDHLDAPKSIDAVGRSYAACAVVSGVFRKERWGRYSGAFHFACETVGGGTVVGTGSFEHCGWW